MGRLKLPSTTQEQRWKDLCNEGIDDDFELAEKSMQAGLDALMELGREAKKLDARNGVRAAKHVASSLKNATEKAISENFTRQKETIKEMFEEKKEEIKVQLVNWVTEELRKYLEEELLPQGLQDISL